MLSPDYYEHCADTIIQHYSELENVIVSDIVRRVMKTGTVTESAKWQIKQLQESGLLYDDVLSEIAKRTNATENHVRALFEDAGVKAVQFDNNILRQAGIVPLGIRQSPAMLQVLNAGYQKTLGNMQNLTLTTANTAQTTYYNACNSAYMKVTSGAFSYQEAIRQAIKETAEKGSTVRYPSGHTDRIDVAIRRSVLTGVGQTCRTISETNAQENNCDLMEITAHSGARPSHAEWQGQIVSLSKRKGYLTKDDIGYGLGDGFGGWNCRHDWFPYFEGISSRNYTKKDLENLNAKDIEYNGKKYSEYEVSQMQRSQERKIRALKRETVAYDTAIKNTNDEALKTAFKDDFNDVSKRLKNHENKLKEFLSETGQQRDRFREQSVGFGRSTAQKAVWANKKVQSSLTSISNNANMKEKEYGILYGKQTLLVSPTYVRSKEFRQKFNNATNNPKVNQSLYQCSKKMLLHRSNTLYEDMYIINAETGYVLGRQTNSRYPQGVVYNDSIRNALKNAKENNIPIITVHNHPEGFPPSVDDFNSAFKNSTKYGFSIGHNGQIYKYEKSNEIFIKQEITDIHNSIALNIKGGMDIDRAYKDIFNQFGLNYEIIKE